MNGALDRGLSEERAFATAWSVVRNGWKKPDSDGKWIRKLLQRTLYVRRNVVNAKDIIAWAKGQGFSTTLPAGDMHVTIAFSKQRLDWMKIPDPAYWEEDEAGNITVRPSPVRAVTPLGPKGAVVLMFNSSALAHRHESIKEAGASWDHPEYQPHITITYDPGDVDPGKIEPYRGEIVLGPEIFEEVNEDWTVTEKKSGESRIFKFDESLGLVFGWAIICKQNGEDYYDLNVDRHTGERVPEHIPEDAMLKAAADFMANSRAGNEMHEGPDIGSYVFAWPMTSEIAKAMGIETPNTGLMIAYKATPEILAKFKDGTYTGFSIEGRRVRIEESEHEA